MSQMTTELESLEQALCAVQDGRLRAGLRVRTRNLGQGGVFCCRSPATLLQESALHCLPTSSRTLSFYVFLGLGERRLED